MPAPPPTLYLRAPAKVNLALAVLERLPDGYHRVETVLQTVSLSDDVTLAARGRGLSITCDDPAIPTDERNLCYRAAALLLERADGARGAAIALRKRIPAQAGLGGGSSDAAATMVGLNRLWGLGLARAELERLAAALGADVPFFIRGGSALATGRGDTLHRLGPGPRLHLVVARRGPGVSTAWAYAHCRPSGDPDACRAMVRALAAGAPRAIAAALRNDLEQAVLPHRPDIAELKARLMHLGALGALMAGSGSAVLGVFANRKQAQETAALMSKNGGWARAVAAAGSGAAFMRRA